MFLHQVTDRPDLGRFEAVIISQNHRPFWAHEKENCFTSTSENMHMWRQVILHENLKFIAFSKDDRRHKNSRKAKRLGYLEDAEFVLGAVAEKT